MKLLKSRHFRETSKTIIRLAVPISLQACLQYLIMFSDSVFVGQYDFKALTAVHNVIWPYWMFMTIFFAFGQGLTIVISGSIGANDRPGAGKYATSAFFYNTIISFGYFLFWFFLGENLLTAMGASGKILDMGLQYLSVLSYQFFVFGIIITANAVFQGVGNTVVPLICAAVKTVLNILLNWVLIYGKFGFPEMGVRGAALGTVVSEYVSAVMLLVALRWVKDLGMSFRDVIHAKFSRFMEVMKIGVPTGIEWFLWVAGQNYILFILNKVNNMYAGYFGIMNTAINLSYHLYLGVAMATTILVSREIGAKQPERSYKYGNYGIFYTMVIAFGIASMFMLFPEQLVSLFTKEPDVITYLASIMAVISIMILGKGFNVVLSFTIRGSGGARWLTAMQFIGTMLTVANASFFVFVLDQAFLGICFAVAFDEIWKSVVFLWKFLNIYDRNLFDLTRRRINKYSRLVFEKMKGD